MKIKIGNDTYDAEDTIMAIYLTPEEQEQISSMKHTEASVYCQRPEGVPEETAHLYIADFEKEIARTLVVVQECDACQAKSGSPTLCGSCLHNRYIADLLGVKFGGRDDLPLVRV